MIPYDQQHTPPALVLPIRVAGAVHARPRITVPALIDTGADLTAVPHTLKERLNLYVFGRIQVEGVQAQPASVSTYEVHLALEGSSPVLLEAILTPYPFAILGRDWLQNYYLLLNGPEQHFQLSTTPFQIVID